SDADQTALVPSKQVVKTPASADMHGTPLPSEVFLRLARKDRAVTLARAYGFDDRQSPRHSRILPPLFTIRSAAARTAEAERRKRHGDTLTRRETRFDMSNP